MKIVLRFVLCCWVFIAAGANAADAAAPSHHALEADDHTLTVWSRVPARPTHAILLVHGRTWSALPDFDLQVPGKKRSVMLALSERGIATYAIDLRGYGATARNEDGWNTPKQSAQDIALALKWIHGLHPRLPKPILLGWSMGSQLSHLTAQTYPDALSDLVLYGYPRDPGATPNIPPTPPTPPREMNTRERAMSDFISPAVITQDVIEAYVTAALRADPVRADWKQLDEYSVLNPSAVKAPTLVIHGERDPLAPIAAQSRLFVAVGNADKQWVVLPGADHAAMLENTHDAFIAAVTAFIKRPRTH